MTNTGSALSSRAADECLNEARVAGRVYNVLVCVFALASVWLALFGVSLVPMLVAVFSALLAAIARLVVALARSDARFFARCARL